MKEILKNFLDSEGRLTAYPSKRKMKLYALIYIAEKIEKGRTFTEKEINAVLNSLHTFDDPCNAEKRALYPQIF